MFEKSSLRTRLSFYLAIKQLGGGTLTLRSNELHLGQGGESIADTAKILSTYGDGFMLRTDSDKKVENFKKYLSIPVINGLSPSSHPTQVLSDVFTVEEIKKKPISKLNICWIGDSNNVLDSLIAASVKFSFKLSIGCPKKFEPGTKVINWVKKNKKKIFIYNDPKKAVDGADVIFSDKIISLAKEMSSKRTMISVSWSLTRQDHGEQPFWTAIMLASMLGQIGLPGGGFGFGYSATNHIGGQFSIIPGAAFPQSDNKNRSRNLGICQTRRV